MKLCRRGVFVWGGLLLLSLGCGSKNSIQSTQESQSAGSRWSLTLRSKCGTIPFEACVGAYGFTLNADGTYLLGPGPNGETLTGRVTTEEADNFERLITAEFLGTRALDQKATCTAVEAVTGKDQITFQFLRTQTEVVTADGTQLCYRTRSTETAQILRSELAKLAEAYYALPFPTQTCEKGLATLESAYEAMRTCRVDADCTYLDSEFKSITGEVPVAINDCETVKPLVIGNKKQVETYGTKLFSVFTAVGETCKGQTQPTESCNGFEWYVTTPGPTCQRGVCQSGQTSASNIR